MRVKYANLKLLKINKKKLNYLQKINVLKIFLKLLFIPMVIYIALSNKKEKTELKAITNFKSIENKENIENIENKEKDTIQIPDIKVCVCTLGRNENRYIREFVSHYEKYGVDKIFLYDNNKDDGEKFEDVINDYIQKGFVEILNWRGRQTPIFQIMNECYNNNKLKYNWIIFYEIDEFINLYNYTNIKLYLNQPYFKNCEVIHLNIINHSDNEKLFYENKSLIERFPAIVPLRQSQVSVKSILRGNLTNAQITWMHWINLNLKRCNGFGGPSDLEFGNDFLYYVIDHYYSKSTEEFINKINRGDSWRNTQDYIRHRTEKYLNQNHITLQKIEKLEKGIGINLSNFKIYVSKRRNRLRHRY